MDYTLDDLKSLKQQWVMDNDVFALELAKVCLTVGATLEMYPRTFHLVRIGEWTAAAITQNQVFVPLHNAFQTLTTLVVYTGDWLRNPLNQQQLWARRCWVNFGEAPAYADDFFVPGEWMDVFNRYIHAAHEDLARRQEKQYELERQALLLQLHVQSKAEVLA
jgi:hypothetical protein